MTFHDQSSSGYLWKSALKARGWTDGAIEKFLGKPDEKKKNPYSKSQPPMLLWQESRVLEAEKSEAFQQWKAETKAQREKDSIRMKAKMEIERQKTIEDFSQRIRSSIQNGLKQYSTIKDLENEAITHWVDCKRQYELNRERYTEVQIPDKSQLDLETLLRWVNNFARYNLSDYEYFLDELYGAIGKDIAYEAMKYIVAEEVQNFYKAHTDP